MGGAVLLGVISLVCVTDLVLAAFFARIAGRAEQTVGAPPKTGGVDPAAARRMARIMFVTTPVIWLVAALFSFGVIPTGNITPITF